MNDLMQGSAFFEGVALVRDYFPGLDANQLSQLEGLGDLYDYWNARINVVSRKDIVHLYDRHVLHSLAMAKIVSFQEGAHVVDLGTGGGFPGIPLAILFPKTHFYLVDSVRKKMKVVTRVSEALNLTNVTPVCQRAEVLEGTYDFVISRAVGGLGKLYGWVGDKIKVEGVHAIPNGLLCWKGGDLRQELEGLPWSHRVYLLRQWFPLPYFADKVIVHLF